MFPSGFRVKDQDNLDLLDLLALASFIVGIQNLELNATANDIDTAGNKILQELHGHLSQQDKRLARIEKILDRIAGEKEELR